MRQDVPSLFLKVLQRFKQIHNCEGALSPKLLLSSTIKKKSEMDTQDLKGMVAHVHTDAAGILHFCPALAMQRKNLPCTTATT